MASIIKIGIRTNSVKKNVATNVVNISEVELTVELEAREKSRINQKFQIRNFKFQLQY